jgi:hypothetical protein
MTERVQQAILDLPEAAWTPAVEVDGDPRGGADVAELTGLSTVREFPSGPSLI